MEKRAEVGIERAGGPAHPDLGRRHLHPVRDAVWRKVQVSDMVLRLWLSGVL